MEIDLDNWNAWVRIARDTLIVSVGTFMLVFETVFAPAVNPYLVGAGLAALGLPPALRLDLRTSSERKPKKPPGEGEEWTDVE